MLSLLVVVLAMSVGYPDNSGGARVLAPCPATPNCVNSLDPDPARRVPPIAFNDGTARARTDLRSAINSFPRARVVASDGPYVRAEFVSAVFRFVDDVEFLIDADANLIHVRSASRVGHYDFGVNRRRVEQLRQRFAGLQGGG
jgi:uncharacterized protein (DUF1499 family)